ncbi:MAG: serine--tRNA ligase [Candidatus Pelagibacter sp.]|nr:serine--tRNA ligase [Candidatus Pelagibacter sp.]|tara:strand:- start:2229 stop:3476 length:1248 start_codon:yes stop_codon:yes gene_type:complete
MHNLKSIRENPDIFKKKILNRNVDINLKELLELDKNNRETIQKKEKLEQEKKKISKSKDKTLFEKSKKISNEINLLADNQISIQKKIDEILREIPNIPLDDVPIGKDDKSNKELKKVGSIPKFNFKVLSHDEIGKTLGLIDFDLATKTSGSRFVFLKGKFAELERAISNFMIDIHTKKFGYQEISPPLIASEDTMYGTGQLPKFENDQFEIKLDSNKKKFLIPTAEVILTNMVREQSIDFKKLPIRLVASTACFRKEAGSYGKDTKGMLRQHQFYKVELVSIVEPKKTTSELERMISCAEEILKKLELPYRSILLSSGDMGFSAEKTIDLEVWIPSENKYREISSCSSCGQFQSRRMKAKYKDENNKSQFLATLNGSGLAIGRTLIAVIENYQNSDGSITIPEALRPYMANLERI